MAKRILNYGWIKGNEQIVELTSYFLGKRLHPILEPKVLIVYL